MKRTLIRIIQIILAVILLLADGIFFLCIPALALAISDWCIPMIDTDVDLWTECIQVIVVLCSAGIAYLISMKALVLFFPPTAIWVESKEEHAEHKPVLYRAYREIGKIHAVRKLQKEKAQQIKSESTNNQVYRQLSSNSAATLESLYNTLINIGTGFQETTPMKKDFLDKLLSQLNISQTLIKNIHIIIDRQFERNSLTYLKYSSAVSSSEQALIENTTLMLERMKTFDENSFNQTIGAIEDNSYQEDNIPDDIQEYSASNFQDDVVRIKSLLSKNDEIISGLDNLHKELKAYVNIFI